MNIVTMLQTLFSKVLSIVTGLAGVESHLTRLETKLDNLIAHPPTPPAPVVDFTPVLVAVSNLSTRVDLAHLATSKRLDETDDKVTALGNNAAGNHQETKDLLKSLQATLTESTTRILTNQDMVYTSNLSTFNDLESTLSILQSLITQVLTAVTAPPMAVAVVFHITGPHGETISIPSGESTIMKINDLQKFTFTVSGVDAKGNPAPLENITATADNDALVSLATDDAGVTTVTALGPLGSTQLQVTADAQIGDGVTEISGTLVVEVTASQATTISINPTEPVAQ